MATDRPSNLALLIDGDNVSPRVIAGLMSEIANYGTASVRRIYGDWTRPDLKGWKACLLDNSIIPIQQFANTNHKNSTDGAMIIDAMDLLYTGRFSSFCLVSSDSDFTRLAARIREQGVTVYGFGERHTCNAFLKACDKFVYLDTLDAPENELDTIPTTPGASPPKAAVVQVATMRPQAGCPVPASRRSFNKAALSVLAKAISNNVDFDGDFASLAKVGQYLSRVSPNLNARNYGYSRLSELMEASGVAELKWERMNSSEPIALVRLRRYAVKDIVSRKPETLMAGDSSGLSAS